MIESIQTMITEQLGPFGPLLVVGTLGLFMILLTLPILMKKTCGSARQAARHQSPL